MLQKCDEKASYVCCMHVASASATGSASDIAGPIQLQVPLDPASSYGAESFTCR